MPYHAALSGKEQEHKELSSYFCYWEQHIVYLLPSRTSVVSNFVFILVLFCVTG